MKRAIVVLLALAVIFIAVDGIVSQLRDQRPAASSASPLRRAANQAGQGGQPKQEIQDPAARDALSLVGADPQAEAYWLKAINNPNLPADERRELIEDLNQDGFPDKKHLTANDLPLILNRLALLEKLDAMDDVNAAAIQEAHKDLVKMRDRLRPMPGQ
jgi:hypothetical protein